MNECKEPPQLVKLCKTRWLVWYPAVKRILEQWTELKSLFSGMASSGDFTARQLNLMYQDQRNLLYLTFLKPVLHDVNEINLIFQATHADITKLYSDLRVLIFSLASRFLSQRAIKQSEYSGVLRKAEIDMLKEALSKRDSYLPYDRVDMGRNFNLMTASPHLAIPPDEILAIRERCTKFLIVLVQELLERMPNNISTVEKLRFLTPKAVMASVGRSNFEQLPLELVGKYIH